MRGEVPDVYTYDKLPDPLKVQIVHIWYDALGDNSDYYNSRYGKQVKQAYQFIVDILCREYGIFQFPTAETHRDRIYSKELANYFLQIDDVERELDIVELSFRFIDRMTRDFHYLGRRNHDQVADNSIEEVNERFKEHGIGFQYVESEIVRVDSELIHAEAVKPALRLLNETHYQGAQQEFLSAYEHYRHSKNKEALNDCLKSFESTMKAICDKHKWNYQPNATSKTLIKVCFDNGLIPIFWQQQFNSLRSMLESSIPTGRNKLSGHGQGSTPTNVPDHLVAYMLHMTSSTLVFLTSAEKKLA